MDVAPAELGDQQNGPVLADFHAHRDLAEHVPPEPADDADEHQPGNDDTAEESERYHQAHQGEHGEGDDGVRSRHPEHLHVMCAHGRKHAPDTHLCRGSV